MSENFKALVLNQDGENFTREIKSVDKSFLKHGDVTVKVHYSGLNYKDALILKNGARLVKEFPHIPGIDFSGVVEESKHEKFKQGDEIIGNETRVKVVKNKVAPPFKIAEFDIYYGEGVSKESELIDLGVKHNIIGKAGAWYSFGSERIGQGKENSRIFLKENSDIAQEIENKIIAITQGNKTSMDHTEDNVEESE